MPGARVKVGAWYDCNILGEDLEVVPAVMQEFQEIVGLPLFVRDAEVEEWRDEKFIRVHAWTYLRGDSVTQCGVAVLRAIRKLNVPLLHSVYGFRTNPRVEDFEIAAFYWNTATSGQRPLKMGSAGVMLVTCVPEHGQNDQDDGATAVMDEYQLRDHYDHLATPVVELPTAEISCGDYIVDYRIPCWASTEVKLLNLHWPKIRNSLGSGAELIEVEERSTNSGVWYIRARRVLNGLTESDAVADVLSRHVNLDIQIETEPEFKFTGTARTPEGISYEMTRTRS